MSIFIWVRYQEEITKLKEMLQNVGGTGKASIQITKEADPEQVSALQEQLSEMKSAIAERDNYMKELLQAKETLEKEKQAMKEKATSGEGCQQEFTELERQVTTVYISKKMVRFRQEKKA